VWALKIEHREKANYQVNPGAERKILGGGGGRYLQP
jgi:hypothetical protein